MKLRYYLNKALIKGQIKYFKSPIRLPILFILKKDRGLYLYINYYKLNKITIKNRYSLPLISKILDYLNRVKVFIKLNLKDIYYYIYI